MWSRMEQIPLCYPTPEYLESHHCNELRSELRQIDNEAGTSTASQSVNLQRVR